MVQDVIKSGTDLVTVGDHSKVSRVNKEKINNNNVNNDNASPASISETNQHIPDDEDTTVIDADPVHAVSGKTKRRIFFQIPHSFQPILLKIISIKSIDLIARDILHN